MQSVRIEIVFRRVRLLFVVVPEHAAQYLAASETIFFSAKRHGTRYKHSRAYQPISSRIDRRKMSFFPRTVRDWNALPPKIAELETLEAFKAEVSSQTY